MRFPQRTLSAVAALAASLALLTAPAPPAAAGTGDGCDPIDPAACLLPFPSDWYSVADGGTATGRRVHMGGTLKNALGLPVSPDEWNRADGFSPGSMLLSRVPGVDLARTGAAPITDIGASLHDDAPIVIVDTATGERWPYWAELDANAPEDRKALIVRPARNFREGHHYAVALRNLRDASGNPIEPNAAFAKILGPDLPSGDPLAKRQRAEKKVLAALQAHGVGRDGLYLAWDFTVASRQSLAGPILHMRDDALRKLGDGSPSFFVTQVTNDVDDKIAREVKGIVWAPSYLDQYGGLPGSSLHRGKDGMPSQLPGNSQAVPFQCEIPKTALTDPARPALYGHGLLGSEGEVDAGNVKAMAAEHGFMFCATKWIGMADEDVPNVVSALADLTRFRTVADRLQQSLVNFTFLGRAMTRGFAANKAFQNDAGRPVIDTKAELTYDGNSQGGIMGGALTAVSPDIRRAVLGVPAMNYSTLLNRSADFPQYAKVLDLFYPDKLDQQVGLALIQMLWDRGEADGYAAHMTGDPLPNTPAHRVLMHVAFGDHQVAPVAAEVEARTIGARIHAPTVTPGRSPDKVPYWGIPTFGSSHDGSAMVVWDSGSPVPPLTNTPPTAGRDPHSDPRGNADARRQKAAFLKTGTVVDVCGGGPCVITP
ncbi:hypothetical protein E1293_39595 [Actinomadura darangshiensis]|uniref:ATP-dependent DNA helicase RecG n=1 Tax=Actinomadura darangshiensis TaxID=705336 RepID=A0A4R5A4T1_9ACTN|nr:hypothetical protein [Actinomadura darangshiensis]TDD66070.1 hypothetical protein E1293_39595 [Actinomadura darangshiensis]